MLMLLQLSKYEFMKKWKDSRYIFFGFIALQTVLLIVMKALFLQDIDLSSKTSFTGEELGVSFALTMLLYIMLAVFISFYPLIEGCYRYERDLSGKQAALELMLPIVSWKKILSKLITAVISTIVFSFLAAVSIIAFLAMCKVFDQQMMDQLGKALSLLLETPWKLILAILYSLFSFFSLFMIIFFCIAVSKSISHRNRIAIPIGILLFIALVTIMTIIEVRLDSLRFLQYQLFGLDMSLSTTILDLVIFAATFFGTSWLMEKKIEL